MSTDERYVVVGCGGVGGIVLRMLVSYLRHRGKPAVVYAVDGDHYEEVNRDRQFFSHLGPKAQVLAEELATQYGDGVAIIPVPHYITPQRARHMIGEGDVVFCTPDNHATRKVVEARCKRLGDVALFSGGNDGVEAELTGTCGNVQVYLRVDGEDKTNPISAFHPEIAKPSDRLPTQMGCGEAVARSPQLLFANLAVASGLLGAFYAWQQDRLDYEEAYFDLLTGRSLPVKRALRRSR
ncbi:MAG: hypothetical protein GY944_07440 [bacterium]|nr:hypothetical protein [bacterium]